MAVELALTKPDPTLTEDKLRVMMAAAQRYVASGLLPAEVNTPQKALVIMKAGRELGIPDTYALRNIHVVKGKPVCSAELLLALVRRTYGPGAIRVGKTTNEACTVQYREQGWDGVSEYTFTIDDAKQAGVANSGTWRAYPAAMLRARCISAVVRFAFPEAIAGLYTPEELGAEVAVTDDGAVEVIGVPARPALEIVATEQTTMGERMAARRVVAEDGTVLKDNEQPAPQRKINRVLWEERLLAGTKAAQALGIDVEELDPAALSDAELVGTVKALSEMVKSAREELAKQSAPAADDDQDAPF